MPYIKQKDRERLLPAIRELQHEIDKQCTPGDLNYIISKVIASYVESRGLTYTFLNDVVGVLDSAKAEFQRKVVAPYEDEKIKENGDI